MSKVLITGVNGFIGKSLKAHLKSVGHDVAGTSRWPNSGFDVVVIPEIDEATEWDEALKGVDVVIHLAARAHIIHDNIQDPMTEYDRTNHLGTKRLAEECVKKNIKRFIYVSSIGVNGSCTQKHAFSEKFTPSPKEPYAISKYRAENALNSIADSSNLELVIIRPPLVYGPGAKGNFYRLLKLVKHGIPLPIASVNNKRSMIGLSNLVDILTRLVSVDVIPSKMYLVSDGEDISTREFVSKISVCMHKKPRIFNFPQFIIRIVMNLIGKFKEYNKLTGDLVIDSSLFRKELGWDPVNTIDQEISNAVTWFHENK